VLIPFLLLGCSEAPPPPVVRDLLLVEPSLRVEVPASVRPHERESWRPYRSQGWHSRTSEGPGGRAAVHSSVRSATLVVPATEPVARVLRFEGWRASGGKAAPLDLELNGITLSRIELSGEPTWFQLEAPASAWRYGENELRFKLDMTVLDRSKDGSFRGLALSELSYGEARPVELGSGSARLSAGTALRYHIENRGETQLRLSATAEGAGELLVSSRYLSPVTTRELEGRASLPPATRSTSGGALEYDVPLRFEPNAILEVELRWESESGAALSLSRAELIEQLAAAAPSFVLISIDTLAARHTSLHGYERATTPKLDAFAEGSTVFDYCLANAPWTLPSYAALMSGYYPSSASTLPFVTETGKTHTVPQARWVLAETLAAAGYRTGAFIDSPNVGKQLGFAQGFEVFDDSARDLDDRDPASGLRSTMASALSWLDSLRADELYFLFVHANDVHGPYLPKADFRGSFRSDGLLETGELLPSGSLEGSYGQVSKHLLETDIEGYESEDGFYAPDPFAAAYDESILSMDAALGEFLTELEERGAFESAVIIFTADHGEAFNEHKLFGHGQLYSEVLHVPLVLALPPHLRADAPPRRIAEPVQLVDLYPTLIEWAGLRSTRPDLHGRSLIPLMRGEALGPTPLFAEGGVMRQSAVVLGDWKLIEKWPAVNSLPWTMLSNPALSREWLEENLPEATRGVLDESVLQDIADRFGDAKPIMEELKRELAGPLYELYNLREDPLEQRDLATTHPEEVERLKLHLAESQALLERARSEEGNAEIQLDEEDRADLEALGY